MRLLRWALTLALFLILFALALQNLEPATLHFYGGLSWRAPFIVWLLVAFSIGSAFGVAAVFVRASRLRREVLKLRRELRGRQYEPAPSPPVANILDAV